MGRVFLQGAHALELAARMGWGVLWTLVLGFVLSGLIQSVVSQQRMQTLLGDDGPRALVLASAFGAAFGLLPGHVVQPAQDAVQFHVDATFWLNLVALGVALYFFGIARRHPATHGHACAHHAP